MEMFIFLCFRNRMTAAECLIHPWIKVRAWDGRKVGGILLSTHMHLIVSIQPMGVATEEHFHEQGPKE